MHPNYNPVRGIPEIIIKEYWSGKHYRSWTRTLQIWYGSIQQDW